MQLFPFLSLICSKELRLGRTTSSHPDNPSAPGELLFMHLVLCSFLLLGSFALVLVVKYIDWLFQLLFPPLALNLSEICIASI